MRIGYGTAILMILAALVVYLDLRNGWGIVSFLGDYLVVLLVLALVFGAIGFKTGV